MRYFLELSYNGTRFHGWQKQPNSISVQEIVETELSKILQAPIFTTGCGRTDTGVHAKQYFLHFNYTTDFPKNFISRINKMLGKDIAIYRIIPVEEEAHARFDAISRSYEYHITLKKNPFQTETAYQPYAQANYPLEDLQSAAQLLLGYNEFRPFCKTGGDSKTYKCKLKRAEWILSPEKDRLVFHISADRFLRGMVRLIVGMCINVSTGIFSVEEVKKALEHQQFLKKSWSVPPQGLFLTDIKYPYIED